MSTIRNIGKLRSAKYTDKEKMNCCAVWQVRYDTFITVYMSDCDFYPRVRAAGWETLQAEAVCPDLHVKV